MPLPPLRRENTVGSAGQSERIETAVGVVGDAVVAEEQLPTGLLVGTTVELAAGGSGGRMWEGGEKGDEGDDQDEAEAVECEGSHRGHGELFGVIRESSKIDIS